MKAPTEAKNDSFQVPALDRALTILELLAKQPEGMRMREISEKLGLPSNSVFRITGLLEERGYLLRDGDDMRYRLSRKLLSVGYAAIGEDKLVDQALDVMQALRDETRETVLVGVRLDMEGIVLEQMTSTQPIKFLVDPGTRFPLHTSAPGKAIMAFLPAAEREALLKKMTLKRFTAQTIVSKEEFRTALEKTAQAGYGIDCAEELEGLHCVGAPIFNHRGYPMAGIWVTGPSFRFTVADFEAMGKKVAAAASRISTRFGYKLL